MERTDDAKTQKVVAVMVFGVLLVAAVGSFLLVDWKDGASLVNALRVAGLVVSFLAGFYAAGLDAAPRHRMSVAFGDEQIDESDEPIPDAGLYPDGGSMASVAKRRYDES